MWPMGMGGVKALLRVMVGPWLGGETRRGRQLPNLLEIAFNTSGTSSAQGLSSKHQLRKQFWDSPLPPYLPGCPSSRRRESLNPSKKSSLLAKQFNATKSLT